MPLTHFCADMIRCVIQPWTKCSTGQTRRRVQTLLQMRCIAFGVRIPASPVIQTTFRTSGMLEARMRDSLAEQDFPFDPSGISIGMTAYPWAAKDIGHVK